MNDWHTFRARNKADIAESETFLKRDLKDSVAHKRQVSVGD